MWRSVRSVALLVSTAGCAASAVSVGGSWRFFFAREHRIPVMIEKPVDPSSAPMKLNTMGYRAEALWSWSSKLHRHLVVSIERPSAVPATDTKEEAAGQPCTPSEAKESSLQEDYVFGRLFLRPYHVAQLLTVLQGWCPSTEIQRDHGSVCLKATPVDGGSSARMRFELSGTFTRKAPTAGSELSTGEEAGNPSKVLTYCKEDVRRVSMSLADPGDVLLLQQHLESVLRELFGVEFRYHSRATERVLRLQKERLLRQPRKPSSPRDSRRAVTPAGHPNPAGEGILLDELLAGDAEMTELTATEFEPSPPHPVPTLEELTTTSAATASASSDAAAKKAAAAEKRRQRRLEKQREEEERQAKLREERRRRRQERQAMKGTAPSKAKQPKGVAPQTPDPAAPVASIAPPQKPEEPTTPAVTPSAAAVSTETKPVQPTTPAVTPSAAAVSTETKPEEPTAAAVTPSAAAVSAETKPVQPTTPAVTPSAAAVSAETKPEEPTTPAVTPSAAAVSTETKPVQPTTAAVTPSAAAVSTETKASKRESRRGAKNAESSENSVGDPKSRRSRGKSGAAPTTEGGATADVEGGEGGEAKRGRRKKEASKAASGDVAPKPRTSRAKKSAQQPEEFEITL